MPEINDESTDVETRDGIVSNQNNALEASHAQYKAAMRIAKLGHWSLDLVNDKLEWSDEIYRIFDLDPNSFSASYEGFLNTIHPDDRAMVDKAYTDSLLKKTAYEVEHRLLTPDGNVKWVHEQCETDFAEDGTPLYSLGIVLDVTERKQAQNELNLIYEMPTALIMVISEDHKIVHASMGWEMLLGFAKEELEGEIFTNFVHPDDVATTMSKANEVQSGSAESNFENRFLSKDGSYKTLSWSAGVDAETGNRYGCAQDITKRKQADEELRKLSRAVDSSSSAIIITGPDSTIEYVNAKFSEITGYTREEALGQTPRILQSEETPESVYIEMEVTIAAGEEWKGELYNRKKDGSFYWARNSISCVKNSAGVITHYIGVQDDVSHEYELKKTLNHQASHDDLTGLINRREFERRAERLLSTVQLDKGEHALCFLDLDQFKVVNDTCGHIAGDELLRQLCRVLQGVVRKRDTLARLGGDEFGILMENCPLDKAERIANASQQSIENFQFSWEGQSFRIGVSIGLVAINETTPSLTELMRQADAACFMAKDLGGNRIHTYHPEDSEIAERRGEMQWVNRINLALDVNRFCLYAQAIKPLDGSKERHYELLLRMLDEQGNIIPPGVFLPAAERYGLVEKLDAWVIENAIALLSVNPEFLKEVNFISINLSGPSLTNGPFLNSIITQLIESGIDVSKICFEVTETAAITNLSAAITFITILQQVGCSFALDDFGSGLSSFGYLKKLPVNYLKIDGMFVKGIVDDPIDRAMVKSIHDVAQVMGMQTVGEFVENDEIRQVLKDIGVNYGQGFGIEKPRPLDELLALAKDTKSQA